jgi:hypothetical protein
MQAKGGRCEETEHQVEISCWPLVLPATVERQAFRRIVFAHDEVQSNRDTSTTAAQREAT